MDEFIWAYEPWVFCAALVLVLAIGVFRLSPDLQRIVGRGIMGALAGLIVAIALGIPTVMIAAATQAVFGAHLTSGFFEFLHSPFVLLIPGAIGGVIVEQADRRDAEH